MRHAVVGSLLLAGLALSTTGCATLATARAGKGTGKSRIFEAPYEVVWKKTPIAIKLLGPSVAGSNQEEGYILAETPMSAFSYGESIAVFVEKVDASRTKVEVVSKRKLATNITAYNWENRILDKLNEVLSWTDAEGQL